MKVELSRLNDSFYLEAVTEEGNKIEFDASAEIGGENKGVRPMQALLMSLAACSSIDVILILKKQKQKISDFRITVDGEREKDKEPALWEKVHVHFKIKGEVDKEKAERAAKLSMDKYCSVAETLRRAGAAITHEVSVNN